jgi:acetolactate synthase-1/2/3 large subunit
VADRCAEILSSESFGIWVGFGARHASAQVRALAERTGALVMCSPRGKGIFPEDHPRFAGVTGFGGHDAVKAHLAAERPDRLLVLGTRLGELTSFWSPDLVPPRGFVHVDLDPDVPGAAYPSAETCAVACEIGAFLDAILERIPPRSARPPARPPSAVRLRALDAPRGRGPVRAHAVMEAVQRIVVEGSDAIVMAEAGNAFAWGNHALRFSAPGRYRVSMGFGSMGQAVAGVVGAAIGRDGKAVAIVGDGAMLMNSEVSTAVAHRVPAVWVVLNDARYGMIEQGMAALGLPFATPIPPCDFAAIARAMGASGIRVEREADLPGALEAAMASPGPFVVDVVVDPTELAPSMARFGSLTEQWQRGDE